MVQKGIQPKEIFGRVPDQSGIFGKGISQGDGFVCTGVGVTVGVIVEVAVGVAVSGPVVGNVVGTVTVGFVVTCVGIRLVRQPPPIVVVVGKVIVVGVGDAPPVMLNRAIA